MKTIDVWRIVTLSEAAKRANLERNTFDQYRFRHDDFPKPFLVLGRTNLYDWVEIDRWIRLNAPYGRRIMQPEQREKIRQEALRKYDHRLHRFVKLEVEPPVGEHSHPSN